MILHDEMSRDKVLHKKLSEHFRKSIQKRTISKILHTGRRFLNNILPSYEQKKKFYAIQLLKQPISPFPLIDTNRHLGKEPMSPLLKNPS